MSVLDIVRGLSSSWRAGIWYEHLEVSKILGLRTSCREVHDLGSKCLDYVGSQCRWLGHRPTPPGPRVLADHWQARYPSDSKLGVLGPDGAHAPNGRAGSQKNSVMAHVARQRRGCPEGSSHRGRASVTRGCFGRWRPDAEWTHVSDDAGGALLRSLRGSRPGTQAAQAPHMNSKARNADRPVHPVVVGIPLALFIATIVFELARLETGNGFFFTAALTANIVGVVMAMLTVIPNATGVKHAVLNSLTVGLFAISAVLLVRSYGTGELYVHLPLAFGMLGLVALAYAGTLGYALPNRLRAADSSRGFSARNFNTAH